MRLPFLRETYCEYFKIIHFIPQGGKITGVLWTLRSILHNWLDYGYSAPPMTVMFLGHSIE